MQQGLRAYRNPARADGSPRDIEIRAFRFCNRLLADAAEPIARINALSKNHELWSILVKDLALENNALPEGLKQNLLALGQWSMRYAIVAMARPELPVLPMIQVNADIIEGLTAQEVALRPTVAAPAPVLAAGAALTA